MGMGPKSVCVLVGEKTDSSRTPPSSGQVIDHEEEGFLGKLKRKILG